MAKVLKVSVAGLRELDSALGELPKATARNVLHRTLIKAAQPMVARAETLAPEDTGALKASISVSSKIENAAGRAEYAAVIKRGGSQSDARTALRAARRAAGAEKTFAEVGVGPAKGDARAAIKALVQEFGSSKQEPRSYMRPAWDQTQNAVLQGIKDNLGEEIAKAAQRLARKKARAASRAAGG